MITDLNKSLVPDSFTGEFYQASKEYQSFSNSSKKLEDEGTLLNPFYESSIIPISKSDTGHKKRKLQANIPDEYKFKNPAKY